MKSILSVRTGTALAVLVLLAGIAGACGQGRDLPDTPSEPEQNEQSLGGQPGGGLEGMMRVSYSALGSAIVPMAGVDVWAQNIVNGTKSPIVRSDYEGRYYISRPPGNYKVCWSKNGTGSAGFVSACTSTTFNVSTRDVGVGMTVIAPDTGRLLRGNVQLADKTKCLSIEPLFGVEQTARAETLSSSSAVLQSTAPNRDGEFVLPLDGAATTLRIRCGTVSQQYAITQLDTSGRSSFAVVIPNSRPFIRPIAATQGSTDAHKGVAPNTVVRLEAIATDPNGDALTYRWRVPLGSGTLADTGSPIANWTVPAVPGTHKAYLSVDDKKGGFTVRDVDVIVRNVPEVLFSGTVHDVNKNPIKGAKITVGGQGTSSDERGNFLLKLAESNTYLVNVEKAGYAEVSRRLLRPASGQEFILPTAYKVPINPAVTNVIVDKRPDWLEAKNQRYRRRGGSVTLPANSLALNPPPVGQLYAYITTYDPLDEDLPGDMGAVNNSKQNVFLITQGSVFIEIRDSADNKYNLASGKTAFVDIPIQDPILNNDPDVGPTIASWTYDVPSGNWTQLPIQGERSGNVYRLAVSSFSTKNADIQKTDPACIRVELAPGVPTTLKSFINVEVAPNAPRRREAPLDDTTVTIYNLPPNKPYTLQIFDSGGTLLDNLSRPSTGAPWGGTGIPPAAATCGDTVTITPDIVTDAIAKSRFLSFKGFGSLSDAQGYYAAIDPDGLRENLKEFWLQNGFNANGTGGTRTAFINNADLGFGRDMNCRQNGLDVACWVTNYGGPDQSPGNFVKAEAADKPTAGKTVTMEYSAIEHQDPTVRVVKFYVFDGGCSDVVPGCLVNSPRGFSANLDGAGEKFVPNLCNNCHGGSYYSGAPVNMGSSFREFDVYSYRDGTAGPKPSDPAFGLAGILAQEAAFFTQNQMAVLSSNPGQAIAAQPIKDLVVAFYPGGTTPFDANALPCGWKANTAGVPCSGNFGGGHSDVNVENLYHDVVAKACRTCHSALRDDIAWDTYKKFADNRGAFASSPSDTGYGIAGLVCSTQRMPHANIPYTNFWRSAAPHHGPDVLKTFARAASTPNAPAWAALGTCAPP